MAGKAARAFTLISINNHHVLYEEKRNMETAKVKIREYFAGAFPTVDLQDDQDIFSLGFVNSLFAMQLVLFVENEFGVTVENEDLDLENFKSVNAMVHLIEHKGAFSAETQADQVESER